MNFGYCSKIVFHISGLRPSNDYFGRFWPSRYLSQTIFYQSHYPNTQWIMISVQFLHIIRCGGKNQFETHTLNIHLFRSKAETKYYFIIHSKQNCIAISVLRVQHPSRKLNLATGQPVNGVWMRNRVRIGQMQSSLPCLQCVARRMGGQQHC